MTDQFNDPDLRAYETSPEGARELAAADAAAQASRLLDEAQNSSGINQKALAGALGVTEGRVSQVFNGDGNVRVGALARYLRSMGYELRLSAVPLDEDLPALPLPSRRERRQAESASPWSQLVGGFQSFVPASSALMTQAAAEAAGRLSVFAWTDFKVFFCDRNACSDENPSSSLEAHPVSIGPSGSLDLDAEFRAYCLND